MDIILMHIIQPYKSRKPAAHRLAKELINKSATYMEPNIQKFFNAALMKGIETDSGEQTYEPFILKSEQPIEICIGSMYLIHIRTD